MVVTFDTNVLIYSCDARDSSRRDAARSLLSRSQEAVLLWQVACEFLAASRKLHVQGFTADHAWTWLQQIMRLTPLSLPNPDVLDRASLLHVERQTSFWDAMIFAACLEANVERIYSEDLPGCPIPGLEVVNPFTR